MLEERGLGETRSFEPPVPLKDAGLEETRRTIAGTAGRSRNRGDPGNHREARPEAESRGNPEIRRRQRRRMRFEETRRTIAGTRKMRVQGNLKAHRKARLRSRRRGNLANRLQAALKDAELRGNLKAHRR
jgi:hypothetical protein